MEPHKPTVLVVDDDAAIRGMLRDALEDSGHGVAEAPDGQAALKRIRADAVDLVLLDLMLPRLGGLEVCRRVRAQARGLYLPVIMMTGLGSDPERHAGFQVGADDYIVKPFSIADVLDRVGVWLRMRERLRVEREQRFAETEATLTLARVPLQALLNLTRVWETDLSAPDVAQSRAALQQAAQAVSAHLDGLNQLLRAE